MKSYRRQPMYAFALSHRAFASIVTYQDLIVSNTLRYFEALSGEEKRLISFEIVDEVGRSGGRFLQRGQRCWIPVSRDEARLKVAQSLQYQRRKTNKTQGISQDVLPPPLLRQEQYTPSLHPHNREVVTTNNFPGRSEIDRSSTSINSTDNHNGDILPFVTYQNLEADSNYVSIAQAITVKRQDDRSESTHAKLMRRRLKISPSQQQLNSAASCAMMPSQMYDDDSVKDSRPVNVNVGKSDPNERKVTKSFQYPIVAHPERVQSKSHTNLEVRDVRDLDGSNKSSSPDEHGANTSRSLLIQGKVDGTLDGSGIHSIGISSDDGQQSLVSLLANVSADSWTETEDHASQFPK